MRFDAVVIGAGMAGLVCAQQLQQLGYRVVVIEKSRGLGGRVATRRLEDSWADHGLRCLDAEGALSALMISKLVQQGILHHWTDSIHRWTAAGLQISANQARYAAAEGITAIAKFLGAGLEIRRGQRVQSLMPQPDRTWRITLEGAEPLPDLAAAAVILAIPAPQALLLLQPLADQLPDAMDALQSVQFAPCITAIAVYPPDVSKLNQAAWQAVEFPAESNLAWVGLEASKRTANLASTLVVQSSENFANLYLEETDLQPIGQRLLVEAVQALPWLTDPALFQNPIALQVHRWRYALVLRPWRETTLKLDTVPLICCGDWCGGDRLESALQSGLTAAQQLAATCLGGAAPQSNLETSFNKLLELL